VPEDPIVWLDAVVACPDDGNSLVLHDDLGDVTSHDLEAPIDDERIMAETRWRVATIALVAVLVLVVGLVVNHVRSRPDTVYAELSGNVTMPAAVLTDTDGEPFDLRAETAGHITMVFFGYTSCPDACPIQMAVLGRAFTDLPGSVRDELRVVFVTTDPARDTPDVIRSYLDQFDETFIGLTGDRDALRAAQLEAGVPAATIDTPDDDGDYLVGHATQVLVFDRAGVARRAYPLGVRQNDWVADLADLVEDDGA
jgi:protein SCO1/2